MKLTKLIKPSEVNGVINAPPSKSIMGRITAAALLSDGITKIRNASLCDDGLTALDIIETLGAHVTRVAHIKVDAKKFVNEVIVKSKGIFKTVPKSDVINCKESGLCMRMFAPILSLLKRQFTLNATDSLQKRPMKMLEALAQLGAHCKTSAAGYSPIKLKGAIKGGKIKIDGSDSSQFLTGLLMALPLCKKNSIIEVLNLKSKPYVQMTISLLARLGIKIDSCGNFQKFKISGHQKYKTNINYSVEGDWSGASFMLVAGAIAGKVRINWLSINSFQADKEIISALKRAGAKIKIQKNNIIVEKDRLNAFEFDANDCPDLFPPLTVLAINCSGISVIKGVKRLKYKESDRATALAQEFGKIGAKIKIVGNNMKIIGTKLRGGKIDSHNDHRIAMAGAIAALNSEKGIYLLNPKCVSKSYPEFFDDLERLKER
ncbi:MAG: 3-phosphoshikimate 1-carboxyvinyltransferase [Candidatus Micrarchaeota archaeon]